MTALRATGMEENTLVVFTTDHGLPLVRAKSTLYDAGLETALIMRWPAVGLQGGDGYDGLFSNVDIVPTLLEGMGLPQPAGVQGVSHWSCLRGGGPMVRQHIFAEKTYHTGYEPMRAVRDERHKLIVNFEIGPAVDVPSDIIETDAFCDLRSEMIPSRKPVELYDLLLDPLERNNLAENPALQGVRDNLGSILRNWMRETNDPLLQGPIASPFRQQALRALGVPG
jgi:arylsulfatase A-like enzyme